MTTKLCIAVSATMISIGLVIFGLTTAVNNSNAAQANKATAIINACKLLPANQIRACVDGKPIVIHRTKVIVKKKTIFKKFPGRSEQWFLAQCKSYADNAEYNAPNVAVTSDYGQCVSDIVHSSDPTNMHQNNNDLQGGG